MTTSFQLCLASTASVGLLGLCLFIFLEMARGVRLRNPLVNVGKLGLALFVAPAMRMFLMFALPISGLAVDVPDTATAMMFDTSSEEVREYVLSSITGCVRSVDIALVHNHLWAFLQRRRQAFLRESELSMCLGMGVMCSCIEMYRGELSLEGKLIHAYNTARINHEMPYLVTDFGTCGLKPGEFRMERLGGPSEIGRGRELLWKIHPPYDPFDTAWAGKYVVLALLTPVRQPIMERLWTKPLGGALTNEVYRALAGDNVDAVSSAEMLRRLGGTAENMYSNRVFQLHEGCVFLVDHPANDYERWDDLEKHYLCVNQRFQKARNNCGELMRLTHEEVSELVYLNYLINGDAAGYEKVRCKSEILKPVPGLRTTFGKRLQGLLREGGMLKE